MSNANKELASITPTVSTATSFFPTASETSSSPTTTRSSNLWEIDYRLPSDTLPLHYEIYLHPNLNSGTFNGTVDIHINVTNPRDYILVHIKFLKIAKTTLHKLQDNAQINIKEAFEYEENEFWVVKLQEAITPGGYKLSMSFSGSLTEDIVGFYQSNYYNSDTNITRYKNPCLTNVL